MLKERLNVSTQKELFDFMGKTENTLTAVQERLRGHDREIAEIKRQLEELRK